MEGKLVQITLLLLIGAVLLYFRKKENKHRKIQRVQEEMLQDYPDIISKMLLLLGAGMTIRGAWRKIAFDYQKQQKRKKRYAYEEMLSTYYEMEGGITELEAYEQFGRRIQIPRYRTFSALLAQHLRKGNKGLMDILERESIEVFEDRKRKAKTLGDQASAKLLFPMILMLFIVLAILMVPAFMSFTI